MRKHLFVYCLYILLFPCAIYAQDHHIDSVAPAADTRVRGVHPWKKTSNLSSEFAHWSLTFDAGFSLIDGDFVQDNVTIIPKSKIRPTGGISLEYSFTPTWSLAGVYTYANYGVKQKETNDFLLYGHMHSLELLLSYDLVDAWFPRRNTNIFSCYLLAGLGMGLYDSELRMPDAEPKHPRSDGKYDMAGIITAGIAAEFNVSRSISLGVKGLYHIYTSDKIDSRARGTSNDCMEYLSGYLRWKLEGTKKNHVRNYANDNIFMASLHPSKTHQPQKDTLVLSHRDTLVINEVVEKPVEQTLTLPDNRYYVYFEHGKADLTTQALIAIQQLACRLQEDTTLCLELNGYCDNTGSETYNAALGQQRADNVRSELMKVYGIPSERLVAIGKGKITNTAAAYSPNRRVEMRLISHEECQTLRKEDTAVKAKTATEPTQENTGYIAVVKAKKNVTTLAKLARKYYHKTSLWTYIYEANKDVLSNPNHIPEGVMLKIPHLTEQQMATGK